MAKSEAKNPSVQGQYSLYLELLRLLKVTVSCPIMLDPKRNFPKYLAGEVEATTETPNTLALRAEKDRTSPHYELKLFARSLCPQPILRFESDGPNHENRFDEIPLPERSISTPHFHKYNQDGFGLAFKTDLLKDHGQAEEIQQDINLGLVHFSDEGNVRCQCDSEQPSYPRVAQSQSDLLQPEAGADPNSGLPI